MRFTVEYTDAFSKARRGVIRTEHNSFSTPVFMPVATQATVKGIDLSSLRDIGVDMMISNAYHLYMRPGERIINCSGGLHSFMGWDGSIATDSGGFQVFSLAELNRVREEGVEFRSHLDGSRHFFSPESVLEFQMVLGSDIMMPLDECVRYPSPKGYVEDSVALTLRWLKRSKDLFREKNASSALFGIVQGGTYKDLRKISAEDTAALDMDGYSLGGMAVGEPTELLREIADYTADLLPSDKVRYLMGVGTPPDILEAISSGIDMFDCVLPTRNGRNGQAFTSIGELNLKNASFKEDLRPIEEGCGCPACVSHSRSYIRHLFNAGEMNGPRLACLHNIYFYTKLMESSRRAIAEGYFSSFKKEFIQKFNSRENASEN
jgi:queuine tRNA-ribosyltransferase